MSPRNLSGAVKVRPRGTTHVNRFYVGSRDIANKTSTWARATIDEAINEAVERCESTREPQIVVKIVAVIEPATAPVRVTRLKG